MDYCTPKKVNQILLNTIKIPPSPYMKKIGFGTGVAVYELERSPVYNNFRSPWAIKKLIKRKTTNSVLQDRLKSEAEILRKLMHPNVVGFRAYLENKNGNNLLAMEECTDCLGDLIENKEEGPFSSGTIMKVTRDIAQGLNYLHNTALIMHCDIKSYNILIKGDFDICKLCDFGVYLPVTKDGKLDQEKAPGAEYIGTKTWSAPEVLGYPQKVTTKADIYSLGLVIWEMLALCPPINEDVANELTEYSNMEYEELEKLLDKMTCRSRPPIPTDIYLGDDYKYILEIYYCCTEIDRTLRPPAIDLAATLEGILNN